MGDIGQLGMMPDPAVERGCAELSKRGELSALVSRLNAAVSQEHSRSL